MATVNKNFKIKHGLVVEGTTGTIDGNDILTKKQEDIDYILDQVGGSGTSLNTPNTLVLRDGSGNFAAGTITADLSGNVTGNLTGDVTGTVSDISNHDTDDLAEGATNKYYSTAQAQTDAASLLTGATLTNITITGNGSGLTITAENGVADSTTDDLDEGTTNLYYTDTRARGAVSAGDGLDYNSGTGVFSADLGNGLTIDGSGQIAIDANVVATDTDVASAVSTHSDLTSGVHGVTGDVVGTSDVQTLTDKTLGSGTTLSANLDADGFTVTGLGTPSNASDAATKSYVDAATAGLNVHDSVKAATVENIDLSTALENGDLLDGVTLATGNRVLVKDQTTKSQNGVYVVQASGAAVRADDYNEAGEVDAGDFIFVEGGNANGKTGWVQTNAITTIGTDAIEFTQFSGAGTYTAGNGLTLNNGTEFVIDTTVTATKTYVDGEIDTHEALTSTHGVSGDIVGTSDQQTLSNKVLGTNVDLGADLDAVNTYKVINLIDPTNNQDAATKKYVDDEVSGVQTALDNLTTTDVTEGTNQYFTDARAKDSAASLLTGATLTNITITGTGSGLTITAENGVDDSTTDDLDEGLVNKYFTNQRALDATSAAYDPAGSAATAQSNAETFATNAINALDTDDIEEGTTNKYFTNQRALDATASAYDPAGSASTAQSNAETFATNAINALDTDDIEEGTTNKYFTNQRALDATASAYDVAGAAAQALSDANDYTDTAVANLVDSAPALLDTLNELAAAIGDDANFASTIGTQIGEKVAKSGDTMTGNLAMSTNKVTGLGTPTDDYDAATKKYVDDQTTSDIAEGTNLYFTDQRAVDALEAVVPNFTEVDLNSVATQIAATASATGSTVNTVYSFAKADYRSAKFIVKVAYGTHTEVSEVLVTLDTSDNIAITEYAIVGTNGSLSTISAAVSGANVNLTVNPVNTATVTVVGTLLV